MTLLSTKKLISGSRTLSSGFPPTQGMFGQIVLTSYASDYTAIRQGQQLWSLCLLQGPYKDNPVPEDWDSYFMETMKALVTQAWTCHLPCSSLSMNVPFHLPCICVDLLIFVPVLILPVSVDELFAFDFGSITFGPLQNLISPVNCSALSPLQYRGLET